LKKKITDNQSACDYAASLLRDSRLLPISLLRRYSELDLNEKELIRLLRLVSLCYNGGTAPVAQAAAEFGVDEEEALALLRPFLDRRLLELDAKTVCYSCEGLRRELYLLWATQVRVDGERETDLTGLAPLAEREEMRALSHLYRRFEQELGRPLRYSESERLRNWVEDEQIPPELIEEALKRAALRDKCTVADIGSILKDWQKKHFTTLAMVLEQDVPEEKEQAVKTEKPAKKKSKYDNVKVN
jgi:DNA replication protein